MTQQQLEKLCSLKSCVVSKYNLGVGIYIGHWAHVGLVWLSLGQFMCKNKRKRIILLVIVLVFIVCTHRFSLIIL